MNLKQWLDQERGRYTALAAHLEVSVGRISQMADDGVPPKYMLSIREFSSGIVSLESMVEARTPKAGLADPILEAQMAEAAKSGLIERRSLVRRTEDRAMRAALGKTKQGA
ncbi:MAG: hypothetical protein Q7T78_17150 [Rhodoferax sp.]|nr:hypothetical protein [Rhodoferax sp.]